MDTRFSWYLVSLLWLGSVKAQDSDPCPCVKIALCPQSDSVGPWAPCEAPDTVRCCVNTEKHEATSHLPSEIKDHLEKEQQLKDAIDNVLEEMIRNVTSEEPKTEGVREDKSISTSNTNNIDCNIDKKNCNEHQKEKRKIENPVHVSESGTALNSSTENEDQNKKEKLIIVYGEKPSKNNFLNEENSKPLIVFATKEPLQETSTDDISKLDEENNSNSIKSTVSESSSQSRRKSSFGINRQQSQRLKLFPKRQGFIPRKPHHEEDALKTKVEDTETAGTEVDEVQSAGSGQNEPVAAPEQSQLPRFRPPPRRLQPQGYTNVAQSSRSRPAFNSEIKKVNQNTAPESIAKIMDEINVKVINDLMKTQFTPHTSAGNRPNPNVNIKPFRYHPTLPSHVSRDNTQPDVSHPVRRPQPQPQIQTQVIDSSLERKPLLNGEVNQANVAVQTDSTSKIPPRGRQRMRPQNTRLPPQVTPTQEQAFDTLRERPRVNYSRRRQPPATRTRVVPDVNAGQDTDTSKSSVAPLAQESTTPSPAFTGRRLRPRQRVRVEPANQNDQNGHSQPTENLPIEKSPVTPSQVENIKPEAIDESSPDHRSDLEGSGSDNSQQFVPPTEVQSGFEPMFTTPGLNVVGPIPGGFRDEARGFRDSEDLGLELPQFDTQAPFDTRHRQSNNNAHAFRQGKTRKQQFEDESQLTLLPPVFPAPQPSDPNQSFDGNNFAAPDFQSSVHQVEFPALNTMLNQHRDLTQLQQDFNMLKSRYDMLLNRYAETLQLYNSRYKELLVSEINSKSQNTDSIV